MINKIEKNEHNFQNILFEEIKKFAENDKQLHKIKLILNLYISKNPKNYEATIIILKILNKIDKYEYNMKNMLFKILQTKRFEIKNTKRKHTGKRR
jgi:hypothetical protein